MIVKPRLPNVLTGFLVAKSLKRRYELRASAIRFLNIRRDWRPRLSVIILKLTFLYPKQKMYMVRHYYIALNRQIIIEAI